MRNRVKVASGGRITIPSAARKQLGIKAGDQLIAELTEEGILYKPIPKLEDMPGIDAEHGVPEKMKKEVDKLRGEY